jgi:thiol:disulfide interchange protein DsbD
MRLLLLLCCLIPGLAFGAMSNVAVTARDQVSLISASNAAAGGRITLGLKIDLAPGWHVYWSNPGDAGLAPQVALAAPAMAGAFTYPPPEFLLQGDVAAFVLSGHVLLPFAATGVGSSVTATASWLVCRDICVPEHAAFTLALPGGVSAQAGLFRPPSVVASPFAATIAPDGVLSLTGPTAAQVASARFFPDAPGAIVNRAPQALGFTATGMTLKLALAPGFQAGARLPGVLELTDPQGTMQALKIDAAPGPAVATVPLALWFFLAFLGGLILNLMPCVFPILAMKTLALARLGGQARHAVRRDALGYTAGVLVAMLLLAVVLLGLRGLGGAVGWGFQFQSPVFVALIAWLIFAAGLSMAGWFEVSGFSGFGARLAAQNSFFNGALAVVVATPCTAPFMGGAIAAALAAAPVVGLGIFLALGLGLASPFLLVALVPAVARILPRPGGWMVVLQRALSLPMFATCLWLGWVLRREAGLPGVALLALGAVALGIGLRWRRVWPVALAAFLVLPFLRTVQAAPLPAIPGAAPFSAAALAALRAARAPVFVDVTASWCVTCLVNDHTSLDAASVQAAFAAGHVKLLVGDWTNRDPSISAFLQANGRDGVPLYVFYPPGQPPVVLPQILTPQMVISAVGPR